MKEILRYKNILLSIIIVVVFIFITKGLWAGHSLLIEDLKKKMSDLESGKLLIERWNVANNECNKLKEGLAIKDEVSFKKFLEEKTKNSGINVTYLSPTRKQEDFYSEISFNLRATSDSYATVVNFLNALEEKGVSLEALKVRNTEDKKMAVDVTVKTFIIGQ